MYLQPATTVGFHRHLDRLVDDTDRGADGNKTKQGFDVIRAQPDTTRADSQTDPEILVGAVDEVVLVAIAKTHGELAEGIVGAGGTTAGRSIPFCSSQDLRTMGPGTQVGLGFFAMTVVVISGVSRPMSPIPMGSTITSCLPLGK